MEDDIYGLENRVPEIIDYLKDIKDGGILLISQFKNCIILIFYSLIIDFYNKM